MKRVVMWFVSRGLGRKDVEDSIVDASYNGGRFITATCRVALGTGWESIETKLQKLAAGAYGAFMNGLDSDDIEDDQPEEEDPPDEGISYYDSSGAISDPSGMSGIDPAGRQ